MVPLMDGVNAILQLNCVLSSKLFSFIPPSQSQLSCSALKKITFGDVLFQSLKCWYSWLTPINRTSSPRLTSPKMFSPGLYVDHHVPTSGSGSAHLFSHSCTTPASHLFSLLYPVSQRNWGRIGRMPCSEITAWLFSRSVCPPILQQHRHHQCGSGRLWRRLSNGCPGHYWGQQRWQEHNYLHLLGPWPNTRYSSTDGDTESCRYTQLTLAATRVHYSAASFCLLSLLLHFTVIFIKELHWASQPESREHMSTNRQTVFTENTQFFSPWAHVAISLMLILAAMHLIVFSVAAVTEVLPLKLKKYKNVQIILCNQYRWIDYAIGSRLNNINQCLVMHISNIDAAQLITVPLLCNILSWITIYSW